MNTTEHNIQIAHAWIAAFNAHNTIQILDLYHKNAVHFSPKLKIRQPATHGIIQGYDAMLDWWNNAFERLPSLQYKLINIIANASQIVMEYKRIVDDEEDMMVAEILEIEEGLILKSRVYHA